MLTWKESQYRGNGLYWRQGDCLSTDEKPTEGLYNGSILDEIDTGTRFKLDQENGEWIAQPSGGGGGDLEDWSSTGV